MAYTKHTFVDGDVLQASQLNEVDTQVAANDEAITEINEELEDMVATDA